MSKRFIALSLVMLVTSACIVIEDSRERVTVFRSLPEFHSLRADGGLEVRVRIGEAEDARISGFGRAVDGVFFREKEGRLVIGVDRASTFARNARPVVIVTTPQLSRVEAMDNATVLVQGRLVASKLEIESSRGGLVDVGSIRATSVVVSGHDAIVSVSGEADEVSIELAMSSSGHLENLKARLAVIDVSDDSILKVRASESVTGNVYDEGSVEVFGAPVVKVTRSEDSKVVEAR